MDDLKLRSLILEQRVSELRAENKCLRDASEYVTFAYCVVNESGEIVGTHYDWEQAEMDAAFCQDDGQRVTVMELFKKLD